MSTNLNRGGGSSNATGNVKDLQAQPRVSWGRLAFHKPSETNPVNHEIPDAARDIFPHSKFELAATKWCTLIADRLLEIEPKSGKAYGTMFRFSKCYDNIFTSQSNIQGGGGAPLGRKSLAQVRKIMAKWCFDRGQRYYYINIQRDAHYGLTNCIWDQDRFPFFTTNTRLKVAVNPLDRKMRWAITNVSMAMEFDEYSRSFNHVEHGWPPNGRPLTGRRHH